MQEEEQSASVVSKGPCEKCGSSDARAFYDDGHYYCFVCPEEDAYTPPEGGTRKSRETVSVSPDLIPAGGFGPLRERKITVETCKKYGYSISKLNGSKCHVAPYRNHDGDIVAQHIRLGGKEFPWIGTNSQKKLQLFGQHLFRDNPTKLIITEGEIDAMSVFQVVNSGKPSRWAVVSVGHGAKGAKRSIASNLSWAEGAEEVILMLDNDEEGVAAAKECAAMFRPGKCKIATLPLKDASDMLKAGRGPEIIDAIFGAKEYRPEGIVKLSDIREEIMTDPVMGMAWFLPSLTEATYGRQYGQLDALGAGTGVGKTDFLTQQINYDLTELREKVGIFFLEQQPAETGRRLAGKLKGRRFHIPSDKLPEDERWTSDELREALEELDAFGGLSMYDHFGVAEYERIEEVIRHLYHSEGTRIFYIDHLTALAAQQDDERKALERIMSQIGGLVKELPIYVLIISHLATPEGKSHEEGGRVAIKHFKGSRSIGFWCHRMFGMERDQQAEDPEVQETTTFRILKDRVTGSATGKTFALGYDHKTGRLYEKHFDELGGGGFDALDDSVPGDGFDAL